MLAIQCCTPPLLFWVIILVLQAQRGPFGDFSEMITVVNSVVRQLEELMGSFAAEFSNVEGLGIVTAFTNWIDILVARDVKAVLDQWASRSSETGFPVAFFELFSATRYGNFDRVWGPFLIWFSALSPSHTHTLSAHAS